MKTFKRTNDMMDLTSWMFIFVMSAGCGIACAIIAFRKGYRGTQILGWVAAGLFFSVFGLIAVTLTHHHEPDEMQAVMPGGACRVCGAPVPHSASRCTHCGTIVGAS
jgi:hypothetical protein